jgi:hypothetical protein
VLACSEVSPETKTRLREQKAKLNPFALKEEVRCQMKKIEAMRRARS